MKGRRILVTGASRGLGMVLCNLLGREGAEVWRLSRTKEAVGEAPPSGVISSFGRWSACDVSDADDLQRIASEVERSWGSLDALVNNAGIWLEGDPYANSPGDISQLISINLTGAILTTRAFHDLLLSGKAPQIVNVGSLAALEPCPGWPVYAASKYGLKGFTDSISAPYADKGIRVTLVNPGGIDTQLYASAGYAENIHQPWMMEAETVARVIMKVLDPKDEDSRISQVDVRKMG